VDGVTAVANVLKMEGVEWIGVMPSNPLIEAAAIAGIRPVVCRQERTGVHMADGFSRVMNGKKTGIFLAQNGPGAENAFGGVAQAYADSVPMLLVSSANRSESLGKGWGCLHELSDQSAVTAPLTAFSALVRTPEDVPELVAQAFTVFHSRRPRPVHISIPLDLLGLPVEGGWAARTTPQRPVAPPAAIERAAALLAKARRPVILVGGGAQDAGDCVRRLCDRLDAAVISSNAGKGVVPESHPLSLGGGLITKAVRDYLERADVILSIGCEISETDSFEDYLTINGDLIRIDLDPSKFNDIYPATVAVQGDAGPSVEALLRNLESRPAMPGKGTAESLAAVRRRQSADLTAVERQHRRLLLELRSRLPADAIMFGDIAQLVYTGSALMPTDLPRTWFYPAGLGTLGCALPGAIGAKIARPDRPVIVLAGDGGFLFTVQELATAVDSSPIMSPTMAHSSQVT